MTNARLDTLVKLLRDDIACTKVIIDEMKAMDALSSQVAREEDHLCMQEKKLSDLLDF